jgi:hypothetical protein
MTNGKANFTYQPPFLASSYIFKCYDIMYGAMVGGLVDTKYCDTLPPVAKEPCGCMTGSNGPSIPDGSPSSAPGNSPSIPLSDPQLVATEPPIDAAASAAEAVLSARKIVNTIAFGVVVILVLAG